MVSNPRVKISQGLYRHHPDVYWPRDGKGTTISHVVLFTTTDSEMSADLLIHT